MPNITFVSPNLYQLAGGGMHVLYTTSGIDGKPHFTYQDSTQVLNFSGDQIERVESELGSIVSVRTHLTVDAGSTTFSVLIPRVNLVAGHPTSISTEGITAVHRFSIVPIFNKGQLDTYTVTPLKGVAEHVVF